MTTIRNELHPATDALLYRALNMLISAIAGTVFYKPMRRLSGIEGLSTVGTDGSTAVVAELGVTGARYKFFSTLRAGLIKFEVWKPSPVGFFWMRPVILHLCRSMTRMAKSNKVVELVGILVSVKQMEWLDVMDWQTLSTQPATLARIPVAFSSCRPLSVPVSATVSSMSTAPSGIVGSSHIFSHNSIIRYVWTVGK